MLVRRSPSSHQTKVCVTNSGGGVNPEDTHLTVTLGLAGKGEITKGNFNLSHRSVGGKKTVPKDTTHQIKMGGYHFFKDFPARCWSL